LTGRSQTRLMHGLAHFPEPEGAADEDAIAHALRVSREEDPLSICVCGHPHDEHLGGNLCIVKPCGCRGFRLDFVDENRPHITPAVDEATVLLARGWKRLTDPTTPRR
jgi:hypothetical protein